MSAVCKAEEASLRDILKRKKREPWLREVLVKEMYLLGDVLINP